MRYKQVFAYTPPAVEEGETFVRFSQAFLPDTRDGVELTVRSGVGVINHIVVPPRQARILGGVLIMAWIGAALRRVLYLITRKFRS